MSSREAQIRGHFGKCVLTPGPDTRYVPLEPQQDKRAEARNLLEEGYGWYTEGCDTAGLQDARDDARRPPTGRPRAAFIRQRSVAVRTSVRTTAHA